MLARIGIVCCRVFRPVTLYARQKVAIDPPNMTLGSDAELKGDSFAPANDNSAVSTLSLRQPA